VVATVFRFTGTRVASHEHDVKLQFHYAMASVGAELTRIKNCSERASVDLAVLF
jgi:hypothetical protein